MEQKSICNMELTRINNDVNGNPRYVVHFYKLLSEKEKEEIPFNQRYDFAIKKSRQIGGKKYHNKSYGGGIAFQSYNTPDLIKDIKKIASKTEYGVKKERKKK